MCFIYMSLSYLYCLLYFYVIMNRDFFFCFVYVFYLHVTFMCVLFALLLGMCVFTCNSCDQCTSIMAFASKTM